MNGNDEEVDLFELSAAPPEPLNDFGRDASSFEAETNVFTIEFDRTTGPKIVAPETPIDDDELVFDISAAAPAVSVNDDDVFDLSEMIPAPAPVPTAPPPPKVSAPISAPTQKTSAPIPVPLPVFGRIAHVCLFVRNLEASINYYSALGMRKRFAFTKRGKFHGAYMEFGEGGNFIELFEDPIRAATGCGSLAHFCIETPDIDAVIEYLTSKGIKFTPKKFGCDATYQIWLKDPDGNDFEIHKYTPKSSQIVGGDVEVDW